MGQSLFQRSFAAGELAPSLHARADTVKYVTGGKTVKNFIVRREGGVSNRPGLEFVGACATNTKGTRLMRFVSSVANQSVLIEMGNGYFRFYQNGAAVQVAGVLAWSNVTAYVVGDLVVDGGVNYYCVLAHTNHEPPNATYWHPLPGAIYEIPTPYSLANLPLWNQSGNTITLTNPNVAPYELKYFSLTRWTLSAINTTPISQPPSAGLVGTGGNAVPPWNATTTYQVGAVVANGGTNYYCIAANLNQAPPNVTYWTALGATALDRKYVVTTVLADTLEESAASAPIVISGFLAPVREAPNALAWTAPAGVTVDSYNIYEDPYGNGVYGFLGTAETNAFKDPGLTPDFESTPPVARVLFGGANDYPATSAYYQQRRFFANTNNEPDGVFGSKVGFNSNFGISEPLQDDDAVTFRLAGNNHHPVRHLVALKPGLVLLTDGGEWTAHGGGGAGTPMTPNSLAADQDTYSGADASVRPVVVGGRILYVQTRGSIVRELSFSQSIDGLYALGGKDMTVFATHLFEGHAILAADYQQVPDSISWFVRDDGVLLGLTYIPDQDVWGWHRHETWTNGAQSLIEDVCVVPEADEDGIYVIVARVVGGATVRYIERLASRVIVTFNQDVFFVDAGLSYHGAPATTFAGLDHLNGQVVAVVADGKVIYDGDPAGASAATFTVAAGKITLPGGVSAAAIDVHIGLAIRYADLGTLPLDIQGSNVRDKKKTVTSVSLLLDRSARSFLVGPDEDNLTPFTPESWESVGAEDSGLFGTRIATTWTENGTLLIRQKDPLPITILGVLPNVELGG